jgi:hypothetical protein
MTSNFLEYFNLNASLSIQIKPSDHLDAEQIEQIQKSVSRISNAVGNEDLPLAIGSSKELSESVAKIALYSMGISFTSNDDYKSLISAAHKALDRHPSDVADFHASYRSIIQAQKSIVSELAAIRNDHGTGHGRGRWQHVEQELALTSIEAALIWCRWVMRRLDNLLANSPITLRKQLDDGSSFYKGDLTKMLRKIQLPTLDETSQRAIGFSVARRARTGTFTVTEEGIDACLNQAKYIEWTTHYKLGLILGLVSTVEGQIYFTGDSIRKTKKLLVLLDEVPSGIQFLIENLDGMAPASIFQDLSFKDEILAHIRAGDEENGLSQPFWDFLISVIESVERLDN